VSTLCERDMSTGSKWRVEVGVSVITRKLVPNRSKCFPNAKGRHGKFVAGIADPLTSISDASQLNIITMTEAMGSCILSLDD
jgi:hypothetical protein